MIALACPIGGGAQKWGYCSVFLRIFILAKKKTKSLKFFVWLKKTNFLAKQIKIHDLVEKNTKILDFFNLAKKTQKFGFF